MNDLKPLLSSDATNFERELLGAAAQERPSPELQLQMCQALGLGPAALQGPEAGLTRPELGNAQVAVKAGAGKWVGGTLLKAALGVGAGAGLVAGGMALRSAEPPTPSTTTPSTNATAMQAPLAAHEPSTEPASVAAPQMAAASAEMSRELREEIELLDRVRTALGQRDARTARSLLEAYSARFPQGTLAREAGLLRARAASAAQPPNR